MRFHNAIGLLKSDLIRWRITIVKIGKATLLLLPVLLAIAGIQGCSSKGAPQEAQQKRTIKVQNGGAIMGALDNASVTPAGRLNAVGWAASNLTGVTIVSVKALVDGNVIGETKNLGDPPRPDVAKGYGAPDFQDSGWKIDIPLPSLPPGRRVVTFRAYNSDGDYRELPGKPLTID
jgi:hypothetical protein